MQLTANGPSPVLRYLLYLIIVSFVTWVYWSLYGKPQLGIDDTCIYLTYVENFVDGYGFVYNPGGERVEGFTSLFWLLVLSGLKVLSPASYTMLAMGLNALLISVALFICSGIIRRAFASRSILSPGEMVFLAFLSLSPGYFDWTIITLMETGLWSAMIILASLAIATDRFKTGRDRIAILAILSLLVLIRPESLLLDMVLIALMFIRVWSENRSLKASIIWVSPAIAVFILTVVGLVLFRLYYFGYPLPNTYYAKVSSDKLYNLYHGIRYLAFSLLQTPMLGLVIGVALGGVWIFGWKYLPEVFRHRFKQLPVLDSIEWLQLTLVTVSLVSIMIPVYVGGDHFKMLRFLQPFFPLYYLMFLNIPFWARYLGLTVHLSNGLKLIFAGTLVAFSYLCTPTPLHTFRKGLSPIDWEFRLAELGVDEGNLMNKLFAPLDSKPTVGVSAAGGFAYSYEGPVVDLMGLNNTQMAHATTVKIGIKNHAAFDKDVFFAIQPKVFHGYAKLSKFVESFEQDSLLENTPDFEEAFVSRMYKQLFRDKRFVDQYKPVIISDADRTIILKTYVSVGFLEELRRKGYVIKELERTWN